MLDGRNEGASYVNHVSEDDTGLVEYQRQLALVDEVIGLRAALAQEAVRNSPARHRVEQLEAEIWALRRSTTWRLGRLMMLPVRLLRRILGQLTR